MKSLRSRCFLVAVRMAIRIMETPTQVTIHLAAVALLLNDASQFSGFSANPCRQRRPAALKAYMKTAMMAMTRNVPMTSSESFMSPLTIL
jgi:hypothetical protein